MARTLRTAGMTTKRVFAVGPQPGNRLRPSARYQRDVNAVLFIGIVRAIAGFKRTSQAVLALVVMIVVAQGLYWWLSSSLSLAGLARRAMWVAYFVVLILLIVWFVKRIMVSYRVCAELLDRCLTSSGIREYNTVADFWTNRVRQAVCLVAGALLFAVILVLVKGSALDALSQGVVVSAGALLALGGYWAVAAIDMPRRTFQRGRVRLSRLSPADSMVITTFTGFYVSLFWYSACLVGMGLIPVLVVPGEYVVLSIIRFLLVIISVAIVVPLAFVPHRWMSMRVSESRSAVVRRLERSQLRIHLVGGSRSTSRLARDIEYATVIRSSRSSVSWQSVVAGAVGFVGIAVQAITLGYEHGVLPW